MGQNEPCTTPADCDDANPCTNDDCVGQWGSCVYTNNTNPCDDADPCTVNDTCSEGECIGVPATEGPYGDPTCSDGEDNNCDGQIDEADTGCQVDIPVSSLNEGGEERESETYRIENDAIGQSVIGAVAGKSTSETHALEAGSVPSM